MHTMARAESESRYAHVSPFLIRVEPGSAVRRSTGPQCPRGVGAYASRRPPQWSSTACAVPPTEAHLLEVLACRLLEITGAVLCNIPNPLPSSKQSSSNEANGTTTEGLLVPCCQTQGERSRSCQGGP